MVTIKVRIPHPERVWDFLEQRIAVMVKEALAQIGDPDAGLLQVQVEVVLGDEPGKKARRALLRQPVSVLNLSVRARKALERLGIGTLGVLIKWSAKELLDNGKNFGATSLTETREKLEQRGLKLKGD